MKQIRRCSLILILGVMIVFGSQTAFANEQSTEVRIATPILVTSAGQSPDALMVRVLLNRLGIPVQVSEMAEASELEGIKSLFVVMGGSQKGLGAAGIDTAKELQRVTVLLDRAEANGITIIGIHIGGEGRRGPLSHEFIEASAPRSHFLIVTEEGNRDGYFTQVAQGQNIGLRVVGTTLDVGQVVDELLAE